MGSKCAESFPSPLIPTSYGFVSTPNFVLTAALGFGFTLNVLFRTILCLFRQYSRILTYHVICIQYCVLRMVQRCKTCCQAVPHGQSGITAGDFCGGL